MDSLLQDLRYALRSLVANPGFAALTILCLSIGIGVNSTIFSVVDSIAIRPLPFTSPDRLFVLDSTQLSTGVERGAVSYADLQDWKERTHSFSTMGASTRRGFTLTEHGDAERFSGAAISANLFPMLGVAPVLGRGFIAEEDRLGAPDVVLLGYGTWQRKFTADPSIINRSIVLNGRPHTVVGVMPPHFRFPEFAEMWVPLAPLAQKNTRDDRNLSVIGRLKDDASFETATADLQAAAAGLASEYQTNTGWSTRLTTLRDDLIPADSRLVVLTMMGAVSLVLLIACANVANLLLARATARQREIAVRTALGAGRARIVRQLLTESVLIGIASAPLGGALALGGLHWLTSSLPAGDQIPYYVNWDMNWRVVIYIAVVAAATGLVFGLAPALQAADRNLHLALKDGGRGTATSAHRSRTRNALVVFEIALSLILLVGASLFVRSYLQLQSTPSGVDTAPMMTLRYFMTDDRYASEADRVRRTDDIVQRVEGLAGVESAFASNFVPLSGGGGYSVVATDKYTPEKGKEQGATVLGVTTNALRTMRVPLLAGRDFTGAEGIQRSGLAIVNTVFARQFLGGSANVVGQRLRLEDDPKKEWLTIVGLVGDIKLWSVRDDEPTPFVFVPYPYQPEANTGLSIRVRGGPPAAITSLVRAEIGKSDPLIAITDLHTGDENRALDYWDDRLISYMFSMFGVVALLLAAIGIYGVLSYSVAQRTQEIGVRMALGASRQDVFALVLKQAGRMAGIGILIGVVGAFGITRIVKNVLFNVAPTDPVSFIGMALFLAAIALSAEP